MIFINLKTLKYDLDMKRIYTKIRHESFHDFGQFEKNWGNLSHSGMGVAKASVREDPDKRPPDELGFWKKASRMYFTGDDRWESDRRSQNSVTFALFFSSDFSFRARAQAAVDWKLVMGLNGR